MVRRRYRIRKRQQAAALHKDMKRVVSVSLGSSKRDKRVEAEFLGERFVIERVGVDGDKDRFRQLIGELDGKVDALGLGGIDMYIVSAGRRYAFRDANAHCYAFGYPFADTGCNSDADFHNHSHSHPRRRGPVLDLRLQRRRNFRHRHLPGERWIMGCPGSHPSLLRFFS